MAGWKEETFVSKLPELVWTSIGIHDASPVPSAKSSWSISSTFIKMEDSIVADTMPTSRSLDAMLVKKSSFPMSAPRPKAQLGTWDTFLAPSVTSSWADPGTSWETVSPFAWPASTATLPSFVTLVVKPLALIKVSLDR